MQFNLIKSISISVGILAGTMLSSQVAQARDYDYHGTECMTANLAQGELFLWNKDGITNNSAIPLYVICPMTYEEDFIGGLASPRGSVEVTVWLSNVVADGTGMSCLARFFDGVETNGVAESNDNHVITSNIPFTVGEQDFFGTGDLDATRSPIFNINNSDNGSAHLLCLVPPLSTLRTYDLKTFE